MLIKNKEGNITHGFEGNRETKTLVLRIDNEMGGVTCNEK